MRAISKILTGSMIAAAALAVSACGSKTETTTDNTIVTDLNTTDTMSETMTDNMTAVDGAAGNGVVANDTMMTTNTTTTTTNAM
jgi:hypothetical protein